MNETEKCIAVNVHHEIGS